MVRIPLAGMARSAAGLGEVMLVRRVTLFMERNGFLCTGELAIRKSSLQALRHEILGSRSPRSPSALEAFAIPGEAACRADVVNFMIARCLGQALPESVWAEVKQHVLDKVVPKPVAPIEIIDSEDDEGARAEPAAVTTPTALVLSAPHPADAVVECRSEESFGQLVAAVAKKDQRINGLKKRARGLQQALRRTRHKLEMVQAGHQAAEHNVDGQFAITIRGKRNLTLQGSMALAVRRNLSSIACADIGMVLLTDVSRWAVARAEVRAAGALMASARSFFFRAWETFKDALVQAREDEVPDFLLYVHGFRSDATNSAIWQRRKLVALELESAPLSVLLTLRVFGANGVCIGTVSFDSYMRWARPNLRCSAAS